MLCEILRLPGVSVFIIYTYEVKQSHNRPSVAQKVPGD